MAIGQQQLGAWDIVRTSINAWFENFAQVFVVAVVFSVPIFLVNAAVSAGLPRSTQDLDTLDLGNVLLRTFVGGVVSVLLSALMTAALVHAFIKIFRGEAVVPGESIRTVFEYLGPLVVFGILTALMTVAGFILLIIPGILAIILFAPGVPALLNERRSGTDAVSRCFNLISGNWGIAISVVLLGFIILIVVSAILGGISAPGALSTSDFTDTSPLRIILQIVASALVAPLVPALGTALYFEMKGRNEGYPSL